MATKDRAPSSGTKRADVIVALGGNDSIDCGGNDGKDKQKQ
jgi:hypothetical protein